jgi:hypothetical protein
MNAICLITFMPNKVWCDFLNLFSKYKIFLVVDKKNVDLREFKNNYKNITFLHVEDTKCRLNGYKKASFTLNKLISGWDKALYYFGVEDKNYDFVWFIEDDVFFNNEDTLLQIDNRFIDSDLLSNTFEENSNGNNNTWLWNRITIQYSPPYSAGMMCAVRFSNRMMKCINNYAKEHNTLFFIEALFPTIAIKNKLKCNNPNEMSNIYYRRDFKEENIDKNNLYHPVKNVEKHIHFRNLKEKNDV